jgi:5-methylcytosine-specific restriction endonuclease McrA
LEREYIFLAPEPDLTKFHAYEQDKDIQLIPLNHSRYFAYKKQVIDERETDPYTFLVDRSRILLLSKAYETLHFPGCREIALKRLRERYKTEEARVARHNAIAASESLPAILNLIEWISTLNYFQWRCAYCGGPYQLIEHYIPIVHGGEPIWSGGTTWSNCVPACRSCNGKKGTQHPSLVRTMPALGRVERYLAAIRTIETMLQQQSEEQAKNAERETLASLDPVDRQIITSYRRNLASSRSLQTLQGRRRTGAIAAITFLLLAIALFFRTHGTGDSS